MPIQAGTPRRALLLGPVYGLRPREGRTKDHTLQGYIHAGSSVKTGGHASHGSGIGAVGRRSTEEAAGFLMRSARLHWN